MFLHGSNQCNSSHVPITESIGSDLPFSGTEADFWTTETTKFFKIKTVGRNDPVEFFGKPLPLKPSFINPDYEDILNYQEPADLPPPQDHTVWRLLYLLRRLHVGHVLANKPQEIIPHEITQITLEAMGYENPESHSVAIQEPIELWMSEECKELEMGAVVMDIATCLVYLISEQLHSDNRLLEGESKLFSRAIAVAQRADVLSELLGRPRKNKMIVLGILLSGSFPTFYIIPVSSELVDAVQEMHQPIHETTVYTYRPPVPLQHWPAGLWRKDNRMPILCAYEAFKDFLPANVDDIPNAWIPYMQDTATE